MYPGDVETQLRIVIETRNGTQYSLGTIIGDTFLLSSETRVVGTGRRSLHGSGAQKICSREVSVSLKG